MGFVYVHYEVLVSKVKAYALDSSDHRRELLPWYRVVSIDRRTVLSEKSQGFSLSASQGLE